MKKNCFFFWHASSVNDADDRLDFLHSLRSGFLIPKLQLLINSMQMLTCVSRQRLEILKGHTSVGSVAMFFGGLKHRRHQLKLLFVHNESSISHRVLV